MLVELSASDVKNLTIELVDELRLPLINRFYSHCNYRVKCGRLDQVYAINVNGDIGAAARMVPQQSGHFLLRNLCVERTLRNQGVAKQLMSKIIHQLQHAPAPANCYCFALPHLRNFYLSLGFKHLSPEQVPEDIAEIHLRNCRRNRDWILMGFEVI